MCDSEEGRPCLLEYWYNKYIFPTVKSALLLLFYMLAHLTGVPHLYPNRSLGPIYMEVGDPRWVS